MLRNSLAVCAVLAFPVLAPLAGCTFGPHETSDDREAVADCKQESDRIYATRNRDELSERDTQDTPFSGNTLPYNPAYGLGDQYQRDQLLDSCLARSAAGGAVVPDSAPGSPTGGSATEGSSTPGPAAQDTLKDTP